MAVYEFRCKECGADYSVEGLVSKEWMERNIARGGTCGWPVDGQFCEGRIVRVFSFSLKPSMPPHYNTSLGSAVTGERQLNDGFKRLSDEATERTGLEHRFVAVDPRDKERLGVTSEGLAATYDRRRALGMAVPEAIHPDKLKD